MSSTIYILLPVHNRKNITERFIKCLLKQTYKNFKLVLIDDGSTDGTAEMVTTNLPGTVILKGSGDWWWGGSLQQGYNWIKNKIKNKPADVVLIINDDTEFASDYFDNAIDVLKRTPNALLLSQAYSKQSGNLIDIGVTVDWKTFSFACAENIESINCLSTRGLFMYVDVFLKTNGFYPTLLPHYCSDYEFTIRAKNKGFKLLSDKNVYLVMDELTTGVNNINGSRIKYLKNILSKRAPRNPIYLSAFIFLSCPVKLIPVNLARTWKNFFTALLFRKEKNNV